MRGGRPSVRTREKGVGGLVGDVREQKNMSIRRQKTNCDGSLVSETAVTVAHDND